MFAGEQPETALYLRTRLAHLAAPDLEPEAFERQVEEIGCAVAAQTADLVPADGKLYALRDASATVPSSRVPTMRT